MYHLYLTAANVKILNKPTLFIVDSFQVIKTDMGTI